MFVVLHHSAIMADVTIDPSVPALWENMLRVYRTNYAILKINEDQSVVIDEENTPTAWIDGENEIVFNKLKSVLDPKEPRYILYQFHLPRDGNIIWKFVFISW